MSSITKISLFLTLGYFILWCAGPLLPISQVFLLGLPVWFWFSCVFAPLILIVTLIAAISSIHHD